MFFRIRIYLIIFILHDTTSSLPDPLYFQPQHQRSNTELIERLFCVYVAMWRIHEGMLTRLMNWFLPIGLRVVSDQPRIVLSCKVECAIPGRSDTLKYFFYNSSSANISTISSSIVSSWISKNSLLDSLLSMCYLYQLPAWHIQPDGGPWMLYWLQVSYPCPTRPPWLHFQLFPL